MTEFSRGWWKRELAGIVLIRIIPNRFIYLYKSGKTLEEIGKPYGLNAKMIRKILMERGVKMRKPGQRKNGCWTEV